MANNPTGFKVTNPTTGWSCADFDDLFVRKECFLEGGLWIWGTAGPWIGDNTSIHRSSPVQTVSGGTNWKQLSLGRQHSAAIKTDGTLWLWGTNNRGELGDNTITARSSPVQTTSGGNNWKQVSANISGYSISAFTAAIKTDGTLWTWGRGHLGQLGNGGGSRYTPGQTISGGNNWKQVSAGGYHAGAIKTDGTLWLWGYNGFGTVGNNISLGCVVSPVQTISGGNSWKQVSTGNNHTAVIKTDGTLWLWGRNSSGGAAAGMLGDGTIIDRSSPVQTVSGGTAWKQVCAGMGNAAIKTDGTLWLWGGSVDGNLSFSGYRSSPVQVLTGGTNWRQVSVGYRNTSAIKTDGTLWIWGYNRFGNLGGITTCIGSFGGISSPVQTISGGTSWRQAASGCKQNGGIREGCW